MNAPLSADLIQVQKTSQYDLTAKSLEQLYTTQKPERFIIENLLKENSLYTLTAPNNGGKSTLAVLILECVAKRKNFGHLRTDLPEDHRVLLLSGEDTEDTLNKMKALGMSNDLPIDIIDKSFPMQEQVALALKHNEHKIYSLVIVDSLQAYGGGSNDNVLALENIKSARRLTELKGSPCVVVLAHPIKNFDQNNLVPYGGGAVMNEVSANLTLWMDDSGIAKLSLGKRRQSKIDSINLKLLTHDVIDPNTGQPMFDNFNNSVTTTSFEYIDPDTAEEEANKAYNLKQNILDVLQRLCKENPKQATVIREIYGDKPTPAQKKQIQRSIEALRGEKCIQAATLTLTDIGRKKQKNML
jgi:hypothetical protein